MTIKCYCMGVECSVKHKCMRYNDKGVEQSHLIRKCTNQRMFVRKDESQQETVI